MKQLTLRDAHLAVFCVRGGVILLNFKFEAKMSWEGHREALDSRVNPNEADGRRAERQLIEWEEKANREARSLRSRSRADRIFFKWPARARRASW